MNAHSLTRQARSAMADGQGEKAPQATGQRRDIQGLRALAVVAVILNHLYGSPAGGFIGVDVFFVISGFLISGLLMREVQASGRISFTRFYARRARRIIPAAVLVVAVTVSAAYALYNSGRGAAVREDGLFSLLFAANWHFAAVGTDYWQADGVVSPLQHYWSLAVEEQFYLFWPWLIIGATGLAIKLGGRKAVTSVTAILMGAVAAASFFFASWQVATAPTWAYFSTFTRTWELALGALVALAVPFIGRLSPRVRDSAALLGLATIIVSVVIVNSESGIPAPGSLLPVLGAALVLGGGVGRNPRTMFLLTNPAAQYVGKISYSLYLWHFPVIILLRAFFPDLGTSYELSALVLMSVLSVLSFHLVEDPLRRSHLMSRRPKPDQGVAARRVAGWSPARWKPAALATQGVLTAVIAAALLLNPGGFGRQGTPPGPVAGSGIVPSSQDPAEPAPSKSASAEQELAGAISAALGAEKFPELAPGLDTLGTSAWISDVNSDGCAEISASNIETCGSGPAKATKTVAVLGDSYAIAWLPGIRSAAETLGYRVVPLTKGQCPATSVKVTRDGGTSYPECDSHREWALGEIQTLKPDLLILADADNTISRLASGAGADGSGAGDEGASEVEAGLIETITAAQNYAGEVVILAPPPAGRNLQDCVTRLGGPDDCTAKISGLWQNMQQAQERAAEATDVRYIPTSQWFCDAAGQCPGFIGSVPVRADTSHLTSAYSRSLSPLLASVMSN